MRLMVNYKGINKQMLDAQTYDDIVKFVHENFFLKMSKWSMSYVDADGDTISLDSEMDVTMMKETSPKDDMKIYIKDIVAGQASHIGQEIDIMGENATSKIKAQDSMPAETVKNEAEANVQESKPEEHENVILNKQNQLAQEMNERGQERCFGGRGAMWKKKIQQKMAKFVDERVQSLLPYIIKKVEQKIQNKEQPEQAPINTEQVNHKIKCNVCGTDPILGIRYKCIKCPLFNLCENCEAKTGHNHNLIKMRLIQEEEKSEEPFRCPPWMKRGPGFMPPLQMMNPGHGGPFSFPPPPPPFGFPGNFGPRCPMNEPNQPHFQPLNQDKEKSCDPRFKITKKCFKMSNLFGGEPKKYEQFVTKNLDLKMDELSQLYVTMTQKVEMSEQAVDKNQEKMRKLGFYFNKPANEFKAVVEKNPAANFKQLITLASKEPVSEPKKQEKPVSTMQSKEMPIPPKIQTIPIEMKPLMQKKEAQTKMKAQNIQKRNACVLEMKELFGDENVFEYINFYNQFSELDNQKIIDLYLGKISGGK